MAYTTVLSNKQSTVGSPYVIYTFQIQPSSRTSSTVNIDCIVTSHLSSSSSHLGTGHILTGYITMNGQKFSIDLKGWNDIWDGTTNHTASTSFQVTDLSSSTTSISSTFSVVNSGGNAGTLGETSMSAITIGSGNSVSSIKMQSDIYVGQTITCFISSSNSTNYHRLRVSYGSKYHTFANTTKVDYNCNFVASSFAGWFTSTQNVIETTFTCTTYTSSGTELGSVTQTIRLHLADYQYKPTGGSGVVSSQSTTSATITLTRPSFQNSATFGSWKVTPTLGSSFLSGDTVRISGISSSSNETGVLEVRCIDSRGFYSDPFYVQYHIRKVGLCTYNGSVYVPATSYLYRNTWTKADGYVWNGSKYVK